MTSSVGGGGPLNGIEWQIDAPWRMEPSGAAEPVYDRVPIIVTFHDVNAQDADGGPRLPLVAFCGLYVLEGRARGVSSRVTLIKPTEFHEIEVSKRWLNTGAFTAGEGTHRLRRVWKGEALGNAIDMREWAEWHARCVRGTPPTRTVPRRPAPCLASSSYRP